MLSFDSEIERGRLYSVDVVQQHPSRTFPSEQFRFFFPPPSSAIFSFLLFTYTAVTLESFQSNPVAVVVVLEKKKKKKQRHKFLTTSTKMFTADYTVTFRSRPVLIDCRPLFFYQSLEDSSFYPAQTSFDPDTGAGMMIRAHGEHLQSQARY